MRTQRSNNPSKGLTVIDFGGSTMYGKRMRIDKNIRKCRGVEGAAPSTFIQGRDMDGFLTSILHWFRDAVSDRMYKQIKSMTKGNYRKMPWGVYKPNPLLKYKNIERVFKPFAR